MIFCVCVEADSVESDTQKTQTSGWTSAFEQDKRDKNNRGYNSYPNCEIIQKYVFFLNNS